jgi:hypothetical protein
VLIEVCHRQIEDARQHTFQLVVSESKLHNLGRSVFTRTPIARGHGVYVIPGERLSKANFRLRYGSAKCSNPPDYTGVMAFPVGDGTYVDAINESESSLIWFMRDYRWIANRTHNQANVQLRPITGTDKKTALVLVATRDIATDEEVIVDYGVTFWGSTPLRILSRMVLYVLASSAGYSPVSEPASFTAKEVQAFDYVAARCLCLTHW